MTAGRGQLSRFAAIFAGGTMLSRVAGLARDVVILTFIPQAARELFLVAFSLPNMLRDMLGEGATNAAFVPVLSECHEQKGEDAFRTLTAACMSMMILVFAGLVLVALFLMPWLPEIIELLRPITGAAPRDDLPELARLAQALMPYLFFIGMTAFAMAPLFVKGHYATPSWSPVLLNLSLIATCLLLYTRFEQPAWALVIGVWVGGVLQLGVMLWAMHRHAGLWRPSFQLTHPGVRRALWLLLPVILGQATGEVNKLVDRIFAISLGDGRVTALYTANRLIQLPLAVFGMAVAVAVLPEIARAAARKDGAAMRATLMHGLRQSFFLVVPAMVGLMVLREPLVALLYGYREFGAEDVARAATALLVGACGLLSFAWVKVCVQGFFAVQNTVTPVVVASVSMFMNIVLNCVLVGFLDYVGLALATVVSFTLNAAILYALLCTHHGKLWDRPFLLALGKVTLAAAGMGAMVLGSLWLVGAVLPGDAFWARLVRVCVPTALGAVSYALFCRWLYLEELGVFLAAVRRRSA